jgi:hypothetical protein
MKCGVCVEWYNVSTHAKVTCPFEECKFEACTSCHERYLLETSENAHCMSCRRGWSRELLVKSFTARFVTRTYKARREELLLEREKALLPATQPYVEVEKKRRRLNHEITELKNDSMARDAEVVTLMFGTSAFADEDGRIEESRQAMILRKRIRCNTEEILHREFQLDIHARGVKTVDLKRQFVRACPDGECRGFLSTAWKCGMCDKWACPECHEVKGFDRDAEHVCNPDNVATARLLDKDTKPCPNCATMIFKVVGCDQMFCTQCHTAFSWRRGTIETGTIHNPHYYEMQRRTNGGVIPRAQGDIPCGGMPTWRTVQRWIEERTVRGSTDERFIRNAHQAHVHIEHAVLPRYRTHPVIDNRDLRIKYMIGDLDEDAFKKKLQQKEKAHLKKHEISELLHTYQLVVAEVFQRMVASWPSQEYLVELTTMKDYMNTELTKIARRYSCVVPGIYEDFSIVN